MTEATWTNLSDLQKIREILMRFDYVQFGKDLIKTVLKEIGSSQTNSEKAVLKAFLERVQNAQPLNITETLHQVLCVCLHKITVVCAYIRSLWCVLTLGHCGVCLHKVTVVCAYIRSLWCVLT